MTFHRPPQPFNEKSILKCIPAVHADQDALIRQSFLIANLLKLLPLLVVKIPRQPKYTCVNKQLRSLLEPETLAGPVSGGVTFPKREWGRNLLGQEKGEN